MCSVAVTYTKPIESTTCQGPVISRSGKRVWHECTDCGRNKPDITNPFHGPVMVKIECPICAKPGILVLIKLRAPALGNARSRCGGSCLSGKISCDCQCMGRCHGAGTCKCGDPPRVKPAPIATV